MPNYRLIYLDAAGRPQAYQSIYGRDAREAALVARATGYALEIEIHLDGEVVARLDGRSRREAAPSAKPVSEHRRY